MKKTLPILIEENYQESSWSKEILKGLMDEAGKKEVSIRQQVLETAEISKDEPVVVLGSALQNLPLAGRLIIAGVEPYQLSNRISCVTTDRRTAMRQVVHHLYACGARRIALIGTDSSVHTDFLRFRGWADAVQELGIGDGIRDAFHANENPSQCFTAFMKNVHEYDAAACTNDYIALQLLSMLREQDISVPDDLMVTGFGNSHMSEWTKPSLTSVSINLPEIGRQAFFVWQHLEKHPKIRSVNISVDCTICFRQSTRPIQGELPAFDVPNLHPHISHRTLMMPEMLKIARLEIVFGEADPTTFKLLHGIARGIPNERLCEESYLSYTAFKRRMSRLYRACGVSSKQELSALLNRYVPAFPDSDAP